MRATWDGDSRPYSQGVKQGVLYPENAPGVPWNGLISVTEKGDSSPSTLYLDGQIYRNRIVPSTFDGTINAFTYPEEFEPCIGIVQGPTAQPRKTFGFSYRASNELHLVYNALAAPSNDQYTSVSDTVSPVAFSWAFTTLPVYIPGGKPSSHLVILLDYSLAEAVSDLEAFIYGSDTNDPFLPDPQTVINIFEARSTVRITDNGDGTWTATGPDTVITMTDSVTFDINWPSAVVIDSDTYEIESL